MEKSKNEIAFRDPIYTFPWSRSDIEGKERSRERYMFLLSDWLHHSARATIAAGRCRSQVGLFFFVAE